MGRHWTRDEVLYYKVRGVSFLSKDVICLSLQEYNENIETLKTEMQQATESGEQIRKDIQETRKKYI